MALRLQFLTVIVRRSTFPICQDLPAWFHELPAEGGFFWDTDWFDAHLWCETAMDAKGAEDILQTWEDRGLIRLSEEGHWQDLCLAASGRGPLGPCTWLEYAPKTNSVWLYGPEPGEIIGGHAHLLALRGALAKAEAKAEAAYSHMYAARRPKDAFEDACQALGRALSLARFLNRVDDVDRIKARLEHIRGVYNAQFRG